MPGIGADGLMATNKRQDNGTGVLHQVAQQPIDQVYRYIRHPCPSLPMQDLKGQGTGCRTGRPVCPSKPHTPCSERQLKCAGRIHPL